MRLFLLLLTIFVVGCQPTRTIEIVKVIDGDTLKIMHPDGSTENVDLAYIDAPEREQPHGREAWKQLSAWVEQSAVLQIMESGAELKVDKASINETMVKRGLAWTNPRIDDPETLLAYSLLQAEATDAGAGIWSLDHALRVPPWVWRAQATERMPKRKH